MPTGREAILNKLRASRTQITPYEPVANHLPMIPLDGNTAKALVPHYIEQSQRLGAMVYTPNSESEAIAVILTLINADRSVLCWPLSTYRCRDWPTRLAHAAWL
jgi:hypothetical protein